MPLGHPDELASRDNLIVMGDFNYPDIDWPTRSATSLPSKSFCEKLFELNLDQLVHVPTHVMGNTLDLIITNVCEEIDNVQVETENKYSDHYTVHFTISTEYPRVSNNRKYLYVHDNAKADYEGMNTFLLDHDFSEYYQTRDTDKLWFYLKSLFEEAIDKFVPKVRIHNNNIVLQYVKQLNSLSSYTRSRQPVRYDKAAIIEAAPS